MVDLKSVLFVCSGNIFRSAFAEYYFRNKCNEKNYAAFSRGTNIFYTQPHPIVSAIASDYNVSMLGHKPSPLEMEDIRLATSIFVMDSSHHDYLVRLMPECESKIYYLGSFSKLNENNITDVSYMDVNSKPELIRNKFDVIVLAIDNLLQENISNEN